MDNYPILRDFLRGIEARCDWQIPLGEAYVEQWRAPNGRTMIITVRPNGNGWDIATPCVSNSVDKTFEDVLTRIK